MSHDDGVGGDVRNGEGVGTGTGAGVGSPVDAQTIIGVRD